MHHMEWFLHKLATGNAFLRLFAGCGTDVVVERKGPCAHRFRHQTGALPIVVTHDVFMIEEVDALIFEWCGQKFKTIVAAGLAFGFAQGPCVVHGQFHAFQNQTGRAVIVAVWITSGENFTVPKQGGMYGLIQVVELAGATCGVGIACCRVVHGVSP